MIRAIERIWLLMAVLGILWLLIPPTLFLKPVATVVDVAAETVTIKRLTPFGAVSARWKSEITVLHNENFECNSGRWQTAYYQKAPGDTVTYPIGEWAERCMALGPPFVLRVTRQVMLFGVIPLRSMHDDTLVEALLSTSGETTE